MNRLATVVAVLASILALAACGGESTIKITGSVLIERSSDFKTNAGTCTGSGDLSAVREGAIVTVDEDVTATLSDGFVTVEGNCRLMFVAKVPDKDVPKRYDFEVQGMPPVFGIVNTSNPIDWQSADSDGWVTIGWG